MTTVTPQNSTTVAKIYPFLSACLRLKKKISPCSSENEQREQAQRGYYRVRKPGPSSSSRRNLTDLTTIISRRRHWESRRAVIPRRVRGQSLSVARLLSRSVRFYFALSQAPPFSPSPPCRGTSVLLSYSPLIHPSRWLFRRLRRAYFGPSVLFLSFSLPFTLTSSSPRFPIAISIVVAPSCPFLALLLDLTFRPRALPPFFHRAPTLPHPRPIHLTLLYPLARARRPSLTRLSRLPVFFFHCPRLSLSFSLSLILVLPIVSLPTHSPELFSLLLLPFSRANDDKAAAEAGPSSI